MFVLDTSVLIPIRDRDPEIIAHVHTFGGPLMLSVLSLVELESGVHRKPELASFRRTRLETMLTGMTILPFTAIEARAYGELVEVAGSSRRKLLDRMIAVQALCADAALVTRNPHDFADVVGLKVLAI